MPKKIKPNTGTDESGPDSIDAKYNTLNKAIS